MEPKEIIAYLKGAINLGKIQSLSANETYELKKILQSNKSKEDSKESKACDWLEGYLDCLDTKDVPEEKFTKIAQRLSDIDNYNYQNSSGLQLGQRLPGGAVAKC